MFGLFDSPQKAIFKRIPVHMQVEFTTVISLAGIRLSSIPEAKRAFAIGCVASVWACNNAASGKFQLKDVDYRHVKNLGQNCEKFLNETQMDLVEEVIEEVLRQGLMPDPRR